MNLSSLTFLAVDFALCRDASGQDPAAVDRAAGLPHRRLLAGAAGRRLQEALPEIPAEFTPLLWRPRRGGLSPEADLRHAMVGDCLPENTVLLEITPDQQKTRVDFACTHAFLGIKPLCVTKVLKRGRQLFYPPAAARCASSASSTASSLTSCCARTRR
jgi:hypothetical protein